MADKSRPGPDNAADREAFSEVQEILTALYEAYRQSSKKRRISDNVFARWLGVSPSNWNYWINGTRLPELKNALILAPKVEALLELQERDRFMRVLGYPNYVEVNDPRVQFILSAWPNLNRETKEKLYELVQANVQADKSPLGRGGASNPSPAGVAQSSSRGSGDPDFDR